jgi:hypothetical protein
VNESTVWVFVAPQAGFPAGLFHSCEQAEEWIARHQLSGVLTEYPVGVGVYDWATSSGAFNPRPGKVINATLIGRFTSAAMTHHHYEDGSRRA